MKNAAVAFLAFSAAAAPPETVMVTYRLKKGSEARLAQVVAKQWEPLRRIELVTSEPRDIYRAGAMLIEIFTWKDAAIPDSAPAEVRVVGRDGEAR